jgi:ribosomal peptide maturation radical SAM protein 1
MDLRYLREVLPQVRDLGYDLSLFYEMKANLTREQVHLLRQAGVDNIQPGIESLSTPILHLMRKGVSAFQNVRLLKWCAQYGIHVCWNMIYGLPGEPPEEYARMAEAVPSLVHFQPPSLSPLWVERFSPYHERPHDFGLELLGPVPWYQLIYPVEPGTLADLAYAFQHRHVDGRDPERYVEPLRRAIETWSANRATGYRSLRYRRGPGFLVICDRRPGLEAADYTFGEREARLYLACEDGATPVEVSQALHAGGLTDVSVDDARQYLDALVSMRLVYKEGGHYLALALPAMLPEAAEIG